MSPRVPLTLFLAASCAVAPAPERPDPSALERSGPGEPPDCNGCAPRPAPPLWGFADLHAHPATHLAFGATDDGDDGLLYGSPGLVPSDIVDLGPCDADKHTWSLDVVEDGTQVMVFTALDGSTGANHLAGGFPSFDGWPSARSLTHQQMHVEWLKRAWEGGLRVMVASATDSGILTSLWGNSGALPTDAEISDEGDYDSAKRQLDYIVEMAAANDWMQVVRTPEEARAAVEEGRLALVLGLEMDRLSPKEILELRDAYGVAVVNPIHLVNNPDFGGTAVYSDLFNVANWAYAGEAFSVHLDPTLRHRIGAPGQMGTSYVFGPPFLFIDGVSPIDGEQCALSYEACDGDGPTVGGHANDLGLYPAEGFVSLLQLWQAGMIVDTAHMSDRAQDETLDYARIYGMPVMNSHSNLRPELGGLGSRAVSERSLAPDYASRIGDLGGMVGLGVEGDLDALTISQWHGTPLERMSTGDSIELPIDNPHLRIALLTADDEGGNQGDNLEDRSSVEATIALLDPSGQPTEVKLQLMEEHDDQIEHHELEDVEELPEGSLQWFTLDLPPGTTAADLQSLTLTLEQEDPDCDASCDNWSLRGMEVFYVGRTDAARLYGDIDVPLIHRFEKNWKDADIGPDWTVKLQRDASQVAVVDLWMGDDNVESGNGDHTGICFHDNGSESVDLWGNQLAPTKGLFNGQHFERPYALPEGWKVGSLDDVDLRVGFGDCGLGCDNVSVSGLRVVAPAGGARHVLLERGHPTTFRFRKDDPEVRFPLESETEAIEKATSKLVQIVVGTDTDDLQRDVELVGTLWAAGKAIGPIRLNEGSKWFDNTSHATLVRLPDDVDSWDLDSLQLEMKGDVKDDWKIRSVEIQLLGAPVHTWRHEWDEAVGLVGEGQVAIGTDLNGMNPLLPVSEVPVSYPLDPEGAPAGYFPLQLPQVSGVRTFDFASEGISNVGQLPEFAQAAGDAGAGSFEPFFRTADGFVKMWERVEAARAANGW